MKKRIYIAVKSSRITNSCVWCVYTWKHFIHLDTFYQLHHQPAIYYHSGLSLHNSIGITCGDSFCTENFNHPELIFKEEDCKFSKKNICSTFHFSMASLLERNYAN
ncbi:hypothetical protein CDAR_121601 [Caerostris darwini]|uniref:Uncharacterized protein n=1 Tax=Caerostris darwini TaxID=1538125 RepID=A0AAV4V9A3_9ARAC|nr:hypothetical protein CDAR_121601 [Caerostris darwini]